MSSPHATGFMVLHSNQLEGLREQMGSQQASLRAFQDRLAAAEAPAGEQLATSRQPLLVQPASIKHAARHLTEAGARVIGVIVNDDFATGRSFRIASSRLSIPHNPQPTGPAIVRRRLALARLIPDIHDRIVTSFHYTPKDFSIDLSAHQGSAFSLEPLLTQSAYFRAHNRDDAIKNFYLVGAGTHPGAGIPGVVGSAKATAATKASSPVVTNL